jgi:membrane-bound lytic murein transglycosylase D
VRVPQGAAAQYQASFEKVRGGDKLETVVLRFGETLDDVARAHGANARELRRLNGVKDTAELRAGTAIVVPRRGAKDDSAKSDGLAKADKGDKSDKSDKSDKDEKTDKADEPDDSIIVAVPDRAFSYEGRERVFYRTRDGDGLDEIADAFGVRDDELCEWNNLDPSAKLHPRMVLQVFVRKDFDPSGVLLLDPTKVRVVTLGSEEFLELETARRGKKRLYYTAKTGDTLAKLGRRYGLTVGDLARINRFSYNTELHEGDKIVVYSPNGEAPRELAQGMTPSKKRPSHDTTAATTANRPASAPAKRAAATPAHPAAKPAPATAPRKTASKSPAPAPSAKAPSATGSAKKKP